MTMKNWVYFDPEDFVYYDLNEAARYVNFAQQHPEFYGLEEPAKVGVVHSIASRIAGARLIEVEERKVWSEHDVKGTIEMLLNLNVPFKMIVSGDGELFKDKITREDLEGFEVVILPAVFMLDDSEVHEIFDYVKNGGKVIVLGEFSVKVVLLGNIKPSKAILYDFEKAGKEEVGMTVKNGVAILSIPSLYAYSVIELK